MIYFNLDNETIKENCKFKFYYNKTDITPTVLDGGNKIILANWPNGKHIICSINNDIPVRIPSHPYVLVNGSVLCNCVISSQIFGCMWKWKIHIDYVLYGQHSFCKLSG